MSERQKSLLRLAALAAIIVAVIVWSRLSGYSEQFTVEGVRTSMYDAGAWGVIVFFVIFFIGQVIHIPGVVFLAAAIFVYGRLWGITLTIGVSIVAVSILFFFVRFVGGQPLSEIKQPFFKRWLDRLEERPITAVIMLRLVLWVLPPLNYALAMSPLRYRDYLIGTVIGLTPAFIVIGLFIDAVLQLLT